jgi:hypothetical protein
MFKQQKYTSFTLTKESNKYCPIAQIVSDDDIGWLAIAVNRRRRLVYATHRRA